LRLQVEITDPLWLAVKLCNDPELKQGFMTTYEEWRVGMGRQYKELNSGKWWEQTEAEISEKHPVSEDVALCGSFRRCYHRAALGLVSTQRQDIRTIAGHATGMCILSWCTPSFELRAASLPCPCAKEAGDEGEA